MSVKAKISLFVGVLSIILYSVSSEAYVPTISVDSTPDGLHVSWTPADPSVVDSECFIVYILTHKVSGVSQRYARTYENETSYTFPSAPCQDNEFVLETRCRTGAVVAAEARATYFTSIDESVEVSDLTLTQENGQLVASWTSPEACSACDVTYHLRLRIGTSVPIDIQTTSNTHVFEDVPRIPCAYVVLTVTPFYADSFGQPNTATFIESAGDAGSFQNVAVNDSRIEWSPVVDNGYCAVTYDIIVRDNNQNAWTFETTTNYVEFNFVLCALYSFAIDSRIGDRPISTWHSQHRRSPTVSDIGAIENIEFVESNGQMLVKWAPIDIGVCPGAFYKIRHYINGIQVGSAFTQQLSHSFPTNYCAEHSIMIQAVVDMFTGKSTTANTIASSRGPDPVNNLQITKTSDSLLVTWDPVEIGFCPITYIVEQTINNEFTNDTVVEVNSATLKRIPCSTNEITVTAVADVSMGMPKIQLFDVNLEFLDPVRDITVQKGEGELSVSWSPIEKGLCEVFYRITNFNGDTINTYETDQTSHTIGKTNCANNTVTVVGIERRTNVASDPSYYVIDVDIDLSKVQNLQVTRQIGDNLQIEWDRPVGSENCILAFDVRISVAGRNVFEGSTSETSITQTINLEPCKVFEVVVTPISPAGRLGLQKDVENTAYLFEVPSVNGLVKHQGLLTWERPHGVGICDLKYRVNVQDESGFIVKDTITRDTAINFEMVPCRNYVSFVKAYDELTSLVSDRTEVQGTGNPKFIEDIRELRYVLAKEVLSVTWNPAKAGDCAVSYRINHMLDGSHSTNIVNQPEFELDTISCSVNDLVITPLLQEGPTGVPFIRRINVGLDVLEQVTDLAVNRNRLRWTRPAFAGNCALTYMVEIIDGVNIVHTYNTEAVFAAFDFIPCRTYRVRVTPKHKDRAGCPTELHFVADADVHAPPTHVRTIPSLASANVTLEVNPESINNCPVEAIRIVCEELNGNEIVINKVIEVEDHPTRKFELGLTNLPHNTHFSCKAQISSPHESEFGAAFQFLTADIPLPSFGVSDVTSTNITVSWPEPQGYGRYILYYVVVVTTVGPNHFVQDSCNAPRNSTEHIKVPATVQSYTITNALPNFKYDISLITRFNIGVDSVADVYTVNTSPSVPGAIIDLDTKFVLENCAQWSGDGFFTWTPPCDINGDLDRFEVTVVTNYTIGTERREYTESTVRRPSDADVDYVFSARIPTLNPFFVYQVSVKTFASLPAHNANVLQEVKAPGAYTACTLDH